MRISSNLPTPMALAQVLLANFRPAIEKLAARAGWQSQEFENEAFLASAAALAGFDPSRGTLMGRAWTLFSWRAARCGFLPRGASRADLPDLPGGEDPLEILIALETWGFLEKAVVVVADDEDVGSGRTRRRKVAKKRAEVERLLQDRAQQRDLF